MAKRLLELDKNKASPSACFNFGANIDNGLDENIVFSGAECTYS